VFGGVLRSRQRLKVTRVDAQFVFADVMQVMGGRDFALDRRIGPAVGELDVTLLAVARVEHPVPVVPDGAGPDPARFRLAIHEREKALNFIRRGRPARSIDAFAGNGTINMATSAPPLDPSPVPILVEIVSGQLMTPFTVQPLSSH
jgi:hypothetical protein